MILVVCSDARRIGLQPESIQQIITSPPYAGGLRDYESDKQIGHEETPQEYTDNIIRIFSDLRPALRGDGTLWLNLGDYYNSSPSNMQSGDSHRPYHENSTNRVGRKKRHATSEFKRKDLVGIPWKVAFAMRDNGWYLRAAIPWLKENAMPDPATDRPNVSHEYWFMFSKEEHYYYDHISVLVEYKTILNRWGGENLVANGHSKWSENTRQKIYRPREQRPQEGGRNFRTYDTFFESIDGIIENTENYLNYLKAIRENGGMLFSEYGDPMAAIFNTASYGKGHYASFPPKMIVPFLKSGTSEYGCCDKCGTSYKRVVSREKNEKRDSEKDRQRSIDQTGRTDGKTSGPGGKLDKVKTIGWTPGCKCRDAGITRSIILDPFCGSGTTMVVANQLNLNAIGCDVNMEYCRLSQRRIAGVNEVDLEKPKENSQISIMNLLK